MTFRDWWEARQHAGYIAGLRFRAAWHELYAHGLNRLAKRLGDFACELDGHGPFAILHISTNDSRREPPIHCTSCNHDVSHLFHVEKLNAVVVVTNWRADAAIFIGLDSRHIFQPGERRIYFRGRYHTYDQMLAVTSQAMTPMPEEADGRISRVGPTVRGARAGSIPRAPYPRNG